MTKSAVCTKLTLEAVSISILVVAPFRTVFNVPVTDRVVDTVSTFAFAMVEVVPMTRSAVVTKTEPAVVVIVIDVVAPDFKIPIKGDVGNSRSRSYNREEYNNREEYKS